MSKELKKVFGRKIGWFFLRIFIVINGSFSLAWSYFLGKLLGAFAYTVIVRHRRIAVESLGIAFPELCLKERKKIAKIFFIFMAQSSFELLFYLKHLDKLSTVSIEGETNLKRALEEGKGVILLTAHIGNFPLMSVKLAQQGYMVNFLTRPMRDEGAGEYLHNLRENAGVKTIFSYPRKECVSNIIKALGNNEIVIMQMDQNFGSSGVWVKFFSKLAATPTGPVTVALRTEAAIIPAYIYRQTKGRHCIKIFPKQDLFVSADKDETILRNVAKLSRMIENWVKVSTYQWGWIHRRWKSQPPPQAKRSKFSVEEDLL